MKLSQAEIEARLAEVRRSYIASLEEKRDAIVTKWAMLCRQWNDETYQSLYLIIHSLAGSAETFGLATITQDARKVVGLFKQHANQYPLDAQIVQAITADIQHLIKSMTLSLSEMEKH
jgi:HPt (histidine-containing phosphotransfer) domain-containing protein